MKDMESAADILARMETGFAKRLEGPPEPKVLVESEMIRPQDIAYAHSICMQCFLPSRHNASNRQFWQTDCGNMSMYIRAGVLVKPGRPGIFKMCDTPAGSKGRIVAIYIDDYAWRHKTPEIDMGQNLHAAMQRMGVKVGGKNGKELQREVENFAAAEINLGFWTPDQTRQDIAKVAKSLTFWMEKDADQHTIWQPTMTLSQEYYGSIVNSPHIAPVYWPAVIGLQHNPMAMDLHRFLTYRLRNGLKHPVTLPARVLHAMFGRGIKETRHFWPEFLHALREAHDWYPTARVEPLEDGSGLKLLDSLPLIPYRKVERLR